MDGQKREKRMFFTKDDDMEMLGLVVNEDPFKNPEKWNLIADVLKERRRKRFTIKNVRERVNHLVSIFRETDLQLQGASGKEEGYGEMDQRLQEVSDLKKEAVNGTIKKIKKRQQLNQGKSEREKAALSLINQQHSSLEIVDNDEEMSEEVFCFPVHDGMDSADGDWTLSDGPRSAVEQFPTDPTIDPSSSEVILPLHSTGPSTSQHLPSASSPAATTTVLPNVIRTPHRPPPRPRKTSKNNTMLQQVWSKLREEQVYKSELAMVEKLKVENEKKRLEVKELKAKLKYDAECKKMDILKQHLDQTARFQEKMLEFMENMCKRNQ